MESDTDPPHVDTPSLSRIGRNSHRCLQVSTIKCSQCSNTRDLECQHMVDRPHDRSAEYRTFSSNYLILQSGFGTEIGLAGSSLT